MKVSYRIRYLLLLGATFIAYGTGIVLGYRPTFTRLVGLPVLDVGWIFVGVGVFMFTSILVQRQGSDRVYYAGAALFTAAWSMAISLFWTQAVGWTAAVSWMCVSVGCLITAAWPEPPRRKDNDVSRIPHD